MKTLLLNYKLFSIKDFISDQFFKKKYLSPLGVLLFLVISFSIPYSIYTGSLTVVIVSIALAVGIPIVLFSMSFPQFGVYVILVVSFFILGVLRFTDLPLGMVLDFLVMVTLLAVVWRMMLKNDWAVFTNPSAIVIWIWIFYNIVQFVNPEASSKFAWANTIRSTAIILLFYFVASYTINTPKRLYTFMEIFVFLSFLLGVYGIFQEINGLLPFEEQWVRSNDVRFGLYYNWGRFRKFSFFTSPTIFGITSAAAGVVCLVLSLGNVSLLRRIYLWGTGLILFVSMIFSGTRTAYAIIPAAIVFFAVITMKRSTLIATGVFMTIGAGIILSPIQSLGPIDANNLQRLRSAFLFEEDPSFNVRLVNQAFIQPYIQSHPIGSGLGSIGDEHSPPQIYNFAPDSGFVKVGVELGYVGLFLYCLIFVVVLRAGMITYLKVKDPKLQNYLVASLTFIYSVIIANYAQESITFSPINIITYVFMAATVNMKILNYDNTPSKTITDEK